jgi:HEAT repeat protein
MAECSPSGQDPAEYVRRLDEELDAQRRRLDTAAAEELVRVLRDQAEPTAARQIAFEKLIHRFIGSGDFRARLVDWLAGLMEDPDPAIAETAVRHCPLQDEHVRARVRALLDSPRDRVRADAAIALARFKDECILPKLLEWFAGESMRNVAIEGLKTLDTREARLTLETAYEAGGRNENDKTVLAIALLRLGDTRGLPFLEAVARRAKGRWSVTAASWVRDHDPGKGLELLLYLLDQGDEEARRSVVNQVWNWSRPQIAHPFTPEGIAEARAWIEERLKSA